MLARKTVSAKGFFFHGRACGNNCFVALHHVLSAADEAAWLVHGAKFLISVNEGCGEGAR